MYLICGDGVGMPVAPVNSCLGFVWSRGEPPHCMPRSMCPASLRTLAQHACLPHLPHACTRPTSLCVPVRHACLPLPPACPVHAQVRELACVHPEECVQHLQPLVDLVAAASVNNFEGAPKLRETVWRCLPALAKAIGGVCILCVRAYVHVRVAAGGGPPCMHGPSGICVRFLSHSRTAEQPSQVPSLFHPSL